jgi:Putative mono-oxygenase ydhR
MIVAVVTFRLPKPVTLAEATAMFKETAPKYQGLAGLSRKNYVLSEDGKRAGGIYFWESRADAERVYNEDWKKMVEAKYGSPPTVEYFNSPVMVDNRDGTISVAA